MACCQSIPPSWLSAQVVETLQPHVLESRSSSRGKAAHPLRVRAVTRNMCDTYMHTYKTLGMWCASSNSKNSAPHVRTNPPEDPTVNRASYQVDPLTESLFERYKNITGSEVGYTILHNICQERHN